MKTRIESPSRAASDSRNTEAIPGANHPGRESRESQVKCRRKQANQPVGNYEYEQMIAEDATFKSRLISEAAYFIAERRAFAPEKELSDWLQAETQIEELLRAPLIERRKWAGTDRRGGASSKA